jgi:phospholipase/carboxylesterase
MKMSARQYGQLKAHVIDLSPGEKPQALVILCHGFGAPGTDLVGLAGEIADQLPSPDMRVRFVFPEAPLDLADHGMWGARAWWHIDMAALQRAMSRGEPRVLAQDEPAGLAPARRALLQLIESALAEAQLPWSRLALGGFSQGAMLTTDVALRADEAPGRLFVCSGTLLAENVWRRFAPRREGLRALMAHGTSDPILPFAGAEALRDILLANRWQVLFLPFHGGHTISGAMLEAMASEIATLARTDAT